MEKENKDKRVNYFIIGILALILAAILVAVLILNFFGVKETRTSADDDTINIQSLYCKTNNLEDSFFVTDDTVSVLHEIKVTFKDEKPDLLSYSLTSTYETPEIAKKRGDEMTYRLWSYLGDHRLGNDYVENSHSVVDTTATINIIGNKDNLGHDTAPIFDLETGEALKFEKQTKESLKKLYTDKGFTCKINK